MCLKLGIIKVGKLDVHGRTLFKYAVTIMPLILANKFLQLAVLYIRQNFQPQIALYSFKVLNYPCDWSIRKFNSKKIIQFC